MKDDEILKEEQYQKTKKKIARFALIILIIGWSLGGFLIYTGLSKKGEIDKKYSSESQSKLQKKLDEEKEILSTKKTELEEKIKPVEDEIKKLERVAFSGFNDEYYARKDKIEELKKSISSDQKVIEYISQIQENSSSACLFDAKENDVTKKYCSLKEEYKEISDDFGKSFDSQNYIPFFMIGGFVMISSAMMAFAVYSSSKTREIGMFSVQGSKPMMKELSKMGGDFAREVTKGIKEGEASAQVPHVVRCEHCGAENEIIGTTGKCEYCKSKISYKG